MLKNTLFLSALLLSFSCKSQTESHSVASHPNPSEVPIVLGAERYDVYLPLLKDKKVGVVTNQTGVVAGQVEFNASDDPDVCALAVRTELFSIIDIFINKGVSVQKIFAPEHGFRGTADAGEAIKDGKDTQTGLPIISLYGDNKKPTPQQLQGLDVVVFDIQDVGARFYTYISTLHYVMEACAENDVSLLVLDRPNPNIHYIDGPILEPAHKSFVGMHPVPVVHGMTMAEYAQMINGQGWLTGGVQCVLEVVPMQNYTRERAYLLPVKPSPNLPNDVAVNLYPSLCFFEGTPISAGRGTSKQFQQFGSPGLPSDKYTDAFTPRPNEGSKSPKFDGQLCYGRDLSGSEPLRELNLQWLIDTYEDSGRRRDFFTNFFTLLAGTRNLQTQIEQGLSPEQIRATWQPGLEAYDTMRRTYFLYPEERR